MVDLHSHILPGVDDGAFDMNETIKMLKIAVQSGFDNICLTPHYATPGYVNSKKQNMEIMQEVKLKVKEENIPVNLYLGSEVFITENMLNLYENGNIASIADTNYILIELPMFQELSKEVISKLINPLQEKGLTIIIAHPERYSYIQKKPKKLFEMFDDNVIFQSNYSSIIGAHGVLAKKTLKKLLKDRVISVLATDSHSLNRCCYGQMQEITKKLSHIIDNEYFKVLTEKNPRAIIENKDIIKLK